MTGTLTIMLVVTMITEKNNQKKKVKKVWTDSFKYQKRKENSPKWI